MNIPIDKIIRNPMQPRIKFSGIGELAASIKQHGVVQPITVWQNDDGMYVIIDGERRWQAATIAKLEEIPALVVEKPDGEEKLVRAIVANGNREDLNPMELAHACNRLYVVHKKTDKEIGELLRLSSSAVSNYRRLMKLPKDPWHSLIIDGYLSERQALSVLVFYGLPDLVQKEVAKFSQWKAFLKQANDPSQKDRLTNFSGDAIRMMVNNAIQSVSQDLGEFKNHEFEGDNVKMQQPLCADCHWSHKNRCFLDSCYK